VKPSYIKIFKNTSNKNTLPSYNQGVKPPYIEIFKNTSNKTILPSYNQGMKPPTSKYSKILLTKYFTLL